MKEYCLLAIDDHRDNLFLLEQLIGACLPECEVVPAGSAAEGLILAETRPFDGALIDVQMPQMDGIQLCRRLKAQDWTRRMPILLITAEPSTPQMRSEGLEAGADDFLSRPIDDVELVARLKVMLRLRQGEQQLRERTEQLAHASRLSIMGEMSTAIAHELNQPLCAIVASAQASLRLLRAAGNTSPAILDAIGHITTQAKRAAEIIQHLREFSRRRSPHRSTIRLPELIRDATQFVLTEARARNVTVRLSIPPGVSPALGDAIQVEQVLINLMRNGIEAMDQTDPSGRELDISVGMAETDIIEVLIRDTGAGLPEGNVERMFNPFFSTKREGMGIGLTISRSIVEAHGGQLTASPGPDCGAVFRFTLPAAPGDSDKPGVEG